MPQYTINYPTADGVGAVAEVDSNSDLVELLVSLRGDSNVPNFEDVSVSMLPLPPKSIRATPDVTGAAAKVGPVSTSAVSTKENSSDPNDSASDASSQDGDGDAGAENSDQQKSDAA